MPNLKRKLILLIVCSAFAPICNAQYSRLAVGQPAAYEGVLIDIATYRRETAKMRADAALIVGLRSERESVRAELRICDRRSLLADSAAAAAELEAERALVAGAEAAQRVALLSSATETLGASNADLTRRLQAAETARKASAKLGRVLMAVGVAVGLALGVVVGG